MMRLVQQGTGSRRPLVALWLVGSAMDDALRAALGKRPTIVADVEAPSSVSLDTVLAYARGQTGAQVGQIVIGGWSLGCSRVRSLLMAGVRPSAVVCADGTTNTWPAPDPAKAAAWRDLVASARRGGCTFAVSHTYLDYTERLRAPQVPYMATVTAMRLATGLPLVMPAGDAPAEVHEGALHVYSYRSGPVDGAAHTRQLREALPMMLARHVAPLLVDVVQDAAPPQSAPITQATRPLTVGCRGEDVRALQALLNKAGSSPSLVADGSFGPKTRAAVAQVQARWGVAVNGVADAAFVDDLRASVEAPPRTLGAATLSVAEVDLAAGIVEVGHNDGPEIRRLYLDPLHLPAGSNWCAAGVTSWIKRGAAAIGVQAPIVGSAAAKTIMAQLQAAGLWVPRARLTEADIVPGTVVVWDRSEVGNASSSWFGHIGVVRERCIAGAFGTIEPNSGVLGNEVAAMARRINDPRLLGIGRLDV